ncbi:FAD-dependent oxidoreductase [Vibrio sp. S9_S30]|uniref:FAD-dependent oxidoreductase n=1 Tax=Vibrio sp. S9_S30 TaxID=2720226 RepID=UPI001680694C|nr:FAD-dependent oxidoreductase [Vibrio sp. S9_S30]MBD1559045.1 FAD-dependent oxidoreductase [Vibrio sp. S9_S30]
MTLKKNKEPKTLSVGIIGGGIAGSTAALKFSELGLDVTLFEKRNSLVNGPPICHLHAGGNLYREISETQCADLLRQSIDTIKLFPHTINIRPTVIVIPKKDTGRTDEILPRLNFLQQYYQSLVESDESNCVLGDPQHYYFTYEKDQLMALREREQPKQPSTFDDWMIPFARHTDLDKIKYPVVVVQEFGWSIFRLSSTLDLALASKTNCNLHMETEVEKVERSQAGWCVSFSHLGEDNTQFKYVDYLVNASGFETGTVDDWAQRPKQRFVEFKAAYVTRWDECDQQWPEVIFHGQRGTPNGMAQLTPYANGVFQLHGMTEDITLFRDGLVTSTEKSSQPKLPSHLLSKIDAGWSEEEQLERTNRAIEHMSQFIPSFATAKMASKPLYGAQQIPGEDSTLRASDISLEGVNYARMEIVKASSAIEASEQIAAHMHSQQMISDTQLLQPYEALNGVQESDVVVRAVDLATQRGYPKELALIAGVAKPI